MLKIVLIIIVSIVSKITGLLREQSLAYCYGTSSISDIYFVSITIATAISGFVTPAINSAYIPCANRIEATKGHEKMIEYTRALFVWLTAGSGIIILASWVFSQTVVTFFASGFTTGQIEECSRFARITVIAAFPLLLSAVISGYLQNHDRSALVSTMPIVENLMVVLFVFLSVYSGFVLVLPAGFTIGAFLAFALLWIGSRRREFTIIGKTDLKSSDLVQTIKRMIPIIIGASATQINVMVDRTLASTMGEGSISVLYYADRLVGIIIGIVVLAPLTILFPKMSKVLINKGKESFYFLVKELCILLIAICVVGTACLFFYKETIIKTIFARGAFQEESIYHTALVLGFYALGLTGYAVRELMTRVYYAEDNYRIPFYNALITVGINISLDLLLGIHFGTIGLALATAISAYASVLVLFLLRERKGEKRMFMQKLAGLQAVSFPSIILWGICTSVGKTSGIARDMIEVAAGMLLFLIMMLFVKPCDIKKIEGLIRET